MDSYLSQEMQTTSFRCFNVTDSISYDDNCYAKDASKKKRRLLLTDNSKRRDQNLHKKSNIRTATFHTHM